MPPTTYIGAGAGFAGDRTDAAGPVVEALARCDGPRFIMFETLAERTLALSQLERRSHPARGYNPKLEQFIGPILERCLRDKIRIVGNFGAANPRGAGERIVALAYIENDASRRVMEKAGMRPDGTVEAYGRTMTRHVSSR